MSETKNWWASRTIWAALIAVISTGLSFFGKEISPELQGSIVDAVMQIVTVVASVATIWFRATATKVIGTDGK